MRVTSTAVLSLLLLSACSGSGRSPAGQAAGSGANDWAKSWCEAMPGNTSEQLIALMGPPTFSPPSQLSWVAPKAAYTAFLNAAGKAKQLQTSTSSMSDREIAGLACKPVRTLRGMQLAAAQAAKKPHSSTPACALVTPAEMSAIVGATVTGSAEEHPNSSTKCTYRPTSGVAPTVEFTVSWGDGPSAMQGMGLAGDRDPGLVTPYSHLGDQAGAAGPLLMIRTGDDLVTLIMSGLDDAPVVAKKILDTAKPRM